MMFNPSSHWILRAGQYYCHQDIIRTTSLCCILVSMNVVTGAWTCCYNYCEELHWHLSVPNFDVKILSDQKKKKKSFDMKSISRVYRIIAWQIWNKCPNLLHKMLLSYITFGSSVSCKQNRFHQKINSKLKMWMLNFEQKISTDAEDPQVCLWHCIVYH